MRDTEPDTILDPEEFASSPRLEATDEREALLLDDIHERPTLVP